jgi:hypothetical protein
MKTPKEFDASSAEPSKAITYARFKDFTEVNSPSYEADLKSFLREMEGDVRSSIKTEARAVRQAHAKSYGLLRAKVAVVDGLAPEYSQGIFARSAEYEAVVRFSNGLAHVRPDAMLGTGCGMGLKMFGVQGPSLLEDERDAGTFDYAFINAPIFFCNTIRDYRHVGFKSLPDALVDPVGRRAWLHQFLTDSGTLPPEQWLWDELLAFLSNLHIPWQNLLSYTYWSMGAVRHGDYIAKLRFRPTASSMAQIRHREVNPTTTREPFRETLVSEAGEYRPGANASSKHVHRVEGGAFAVRYRGPHHDPFPGHLPTSQSGSCRQDFDNGVARPGSASSARGDHAGSKGSVPALLHSASPTQ